MRRNERNEIISDNRGNSEMSCCGTKTTLAPVLVAKVYNQVIIEEIPNSAMSMTMNNTAAITCARSEGCSEYGYNNVGYVANNNDMLNDEYTY